MDSDNPDDEEAKALKIRAGEDYKQVLQSIAGQCLAIKWSCYLAFACWVVMLLETSHPHSMAFLCCAEAHHALSGPGPADLEFQQ